MYLGQGYVQQGKWVCEEIKMRYDFTKVQQTYLKQDFKRPSARFGSGLRLLYTGINEKYLPGNCTNWHTTGFWKKGVVDTSGKFPQPDETGPYHSVYEPRVTGIDRRVHWEVPEGCRPQLVMVGGYDVNDYSMIDIWFFDLWNSTWTEVFPKPDPSAYPKNYV